MKTLFPVSACLLCSVLSFPTQAELTAELELANLYLFRGINMSQSGSPMVAGELNYQHQSGLYAGVWSTSGDDAGVEVDYYLGFTGKVSNLEYDISYLNYYYPSQKGTAGAIVDFNDYAELSLSLDYLGAGFSVTTPTKEEAAGGYQYYTLGYGNEQFSATLGVNDHEDKRNDYSHLDLAYHINDQLSFVVSQVLTKGSGSNLNNATLWQISYHLPINF